MTTNPPAQHPTTASGPAAVPSTDALSVLSTLDDPLRRRLYDFVCTQDKPVSRDTAAAEADIGRTLAAYHLDKLADAGLLGTSYQRPPGRSGPGAGRPAKLYARAEGEFSASAPARDYELLARMLVEAAEQDTTGVVRNALGTAAADAGRQAAVGARSNLPAEPAPGPDEVVDAALRGCGYLPGATADGRVEMRNCPFHRVSREHPETVCGLNLHLVEGLVAEAGADPGRAVLDPCDGRCCVVIHPE